MAGGDQVIGDDGNTQDRWTITGEVRYEELTEKSEADYVTDSTYKQTQAGSCGEDNGTLVCKK